MPDISVFGPKIATLARLRHNPCQPNTTSPEDVCGNRHMVIESTMSENRHQGHLTADAALPQEFLAAENASLRLLLEQAEIDARDLLAQAGIDAREREVADKLQKLILEELHHRIKNTLATVRDR